MEVAWPPNISIAPEMCDLIVRGGVGLLIGKSVTFSEEFTTCGELYQEGWTGSISCCMRKRSAAFAGSSGLVFARQHQIFSWYKIPCSSSATRNNSS